MRFGILLFEVQSQHGHRSWFYSLKFYLNWQIQMSNKSALLPYDNVIRRISLNQHDRIPSNREERNEEREKIK